MNCPTDFFFTKFTIFGAAAVVQPLTWTTLLLPAPVGAPGRLR